MRSFKLSLAILVMIFAYLMSVNSNGNSKSPGQSKIGQLDSAIRINKKILRLQISMKDSSLMTK